MMNPDKHLLWFLRASTAFLIAGLTALWVLMGSSCANQGMGPDGGLRDSIAPEVVRSIPENYQTNVKENQIEVIFNEYVVPDNLNEKLVVSPPLAQRPTIRTKGRGIVVKINEDLIPDRTYSIDFKDGIKDYNEGNKIESFRMIFSTYDQLDTLQIKGKLLDAFTLLPVVNSVMTLYTIDNDSAFRTLKPDFIARTDKHGRFLFDNLPQKEYKLYGLTDGDNNLMYNQPAEQIAFVDSSIQVNAVYMEVVDTIYHQPDTLQSVAGSLKTDTLSATVHTEPSDSLLNPVFVTRGITRFSPDSIVCLHFTEKRLNRYIKSYKRPERERISLQFTEALCDSFQYRLLQFSDSLIWSYDEYSVRRDSIEFWITDSLVASTDTLLMAVRYMKTGRDETTALSVDTIKLIYSDPVVKRGKQEQEEVDDEAQKAKLFPISLSLSGNEVDLNRRIELIMALPIDSLPAEAIGFSKFIDDSTTVEAPYTLEKVPDSKRKFVINHSLSEATKYRLKIDSAAVFSVTGIPNKTFESTFKTQKADFYGSIILDIQGFEGKGIVYLLRNSEKEEVVDIVHLPNGSQEITFSYVKPEKYRIKLLHDLDGNGEWTTGSLNERRQPERVYYFPKILKVRSNWDSRERWDINQGIIVPKELYDDEQDKK